MAIKIDFKQSSWDKVKPKDLKKDALSGALKDVEKTMGDNKKIAACIAALRQVSSAADDLMGGECSAKKDKELNAALKKLMADAEAEIKKLQAALESEGEEGEDDEDGDLNKLLNKDKFAIFLKKAKSASGGSDGPGACFCFHMKDAAKCELVFDMPAKIQSRYTKLKARLPKEDSDFKKRNIVKGFAYREDKFLVIECQAGEEPPEVPGMDKKLRNWAKSHKKDIAPMKKVRMSIPGMAPIVIDVPEDDEIEGATTDSEEQVTNTTTPPKAPPVPPNATTTSSSTVPPQAPPQTNGAPTNAVELENRRKEFRKARQAWQSAKEKAIQDLEMVKDCIRDYYLDDPEMFKIASSKLKQLDSIMDNLGDDLRDILDKYVSTPKSKQSELQRLASEASATVNRFLDYVSKDALLSAVDNESEMGVGDIKVREPLQKALKDLVKTLG